MRMQVSTVVRVIWSTACSSIRPLCPLTSFAQLIQGYSIYPASLSIYLHWVPPKSNHVIWLPLIQSHSCLRSCHWCVQRIQWLQNRQLHSLSPKSSPVQLDASISVPLSGDAHLHSTSCHRTFQSWSNINRSQPPICDLGKLFQPPLGLCNHEEQHLWQVIIAYPTE